MTDGWFEEWLERNLVKSSLANFFQNSIWSYLIIPIFNALLGCALLVSSIMASKCQPSLELQMKHRHISSEEKADKIPAEEYRDSFSSLNRRRVWVSVVATSLPLLATILMNYDNNFPSLISKVDTLIILASAVGHILATIALYILLAKGNDPSGGTIMFWSWALLVGAVRLGLISTKIPASTMEVVRYLGSLMFPLACCGVLWVCNVQREPVDLSTDENESFIIEDPETKKGVCSYLWQTMRCLTFSWVTPFLRRAHHVGLTAHDMPKLLKRENVEGLYGKIVKAWMQIRRKRGNRRITVLRLLITTFWRDLITTGAVKVISDILMSICPLFVKGVIKSVNEAPNNPDAIWKGMMFVLGMTVFSLVQSIFLHQYFQGQFRLSMRIRAVLTTLLFNKALRSKQGIQEGSTEKTSSAINLMSSDTSRLQDLIIYIHMIWSAPFQIILTTVFLFHTIGVAAMASVVCIILLVPLSLLNSRFAIKWQVETSKRKDKRLTTTTEVLTSVRTIKIMSWVECAKKRINDLRAPEIHGLTRVAIAEMIGRILWNMAPIIVTLGTLSTAAALGVEMNAANVFTTVALTSSYRFPMCLLPSILNATLQAYVSLKRIDEYLGGPEVQGLRPSRTGLTQEKDRSTYSLEHREADTDNGTNGGIPRPVDAFESLLPQLTSHTTSNMWVPQMNADESPSTGAGYVQLKDSEETIQGMSEMPRICVTNASFGVGNMMLLEDISLTLKPGNIVCITGPMGCGKTTLLKGFLGEVDLLQGYLQCTGRIAYIDQSPHVTNSSVVENISFYTPLNVNRLGAVLKTSCLDEDLENFKDGIWSTVGTGGVTLSGGQRARLSLSRALYADANIWLFDDFTYALDCKVASKIIQRMFAKKESLQDKVIVLISNWEPLMQMADRIIELGDKRVVFDGTYMEYQSRLSQRFFLDPVAVTCPKLTCSRKSSLMSAADDDPASFVELQSTAEPATADTTQDLIGETTGRPNHVQDIRYGLSDNVEVLKSRTNWKKLYQGYLKRSGGYGLWMMLLMSLCSAAAMRLVASTFLSRWVNPEYGLDYRTGFGRYGMACTAYGAFVCLGFALAAICSIIGARRFHEEMLNSVISAPMSFFESIPIGNTMNRFTKDLTCVDQKLPSVLPTSITLVAGATLTCATVAFYFPIFIYPLVILCNVYWKVQIAYLSITRQCLRLDVAARSPIFSHFTETLGGSTTIRAFEREKDYIKTLFAMCTLSLRAYYLVVSTNRWLAIRLEVLGSTLMALTTSLCVIGNSYINAGVTGLMITLALDSIRSLGWTVRQAGEREVALIGLERLVDYMEYLPAEGATKAIAQTPPPSWPQSGQIEFKNVVLQYQPGLPFVLKNLNLKIEAGQRVAIAGRTGAGKSSILAALIRLVELTEGTITIDGVDVSVLTLDSLRSRLCLISQDSLLFTGTWRDNLDPEGRHSDEALWNIIDSLGLRECAERQDENGECRGLQTSMKSDAVALSAGQKQLLCLGRVLLKKSSVLFMDEATAIVDAECDRIIQESIRRECRQSTVVAIAHRLETVMNYDRVIVLHAGQIVEDGNPQQLIKDRTSRLWDTFARSKSDVAIKSVSHPRNP